MWDHRPDPERDRRLAARPRHQRRRAQGIDELVGRYTRSPEFRRLERMRRVRTALASLFSSAICARIEVARLGRQGLVLAVSDSLLLAELRNHHHARLLSALAAYGVGTQQVRYRLRRSQTTPTAPGPKPGGSSRQ
jgi:hypothetical protein